MTNLQQAGADLDANWRRLAQRWEEVRGVWADSTRDEFAKRTMQPLQAETQAMYKSMGTLAQVLQQAQHSVK